MARHLNTHAVLRERLHKQAGLHELPRAKHRLEDLERTEWSPLFERLMRNRLIMGALRYGLLSDKRKKGKKWDLLEPIGKKLALYERTGNTEYLVDAANYCLLAFECDNHPHKHFRALDDHHDHCKLRKGDRVVKLAPSHDDVILQDLAALANEWGWHPGMTTSPVEVLRMAMRHKQPRITAKPLRFRAH